MLQALLAGAGSKIYGGVEAYKSSKARAGLMTQQGELIKEEAYTDAARIRDEGYRFSQEQVMAYISSGVEMQGTPLLLSNETISMANFEAKATEKRGEAELSLAQANAKITKREGKAQMISSIIGAGTDLGTAFK